MMISIAEWSSLNFLFNLMKLICIKYDNILDFNENRRLYLLHRGLCLPKMPVNKSFDELKSLIYTIPIQN